MAAGSAAASTYYVDALKGDDTHDGSQAFPWKTIGKAANTMVAGDTTTVNAGTYTESRVVQSTSGSAGNLIRYVTSGGTVDINNGVKITGNYISFAGVFRVPNLAAQCGSPCTDFTNYAPVYITGTMTRSTAGPSRATASPASRWALGPRTRPSRTT